METNTQNNMLTDKYIPFITLESRSANEKYFDSLAQELIQYGHPEDRARYIVKRNISVFSSYWSDDVKKRIKDYFDIDPLESL